MAEQDMKDRFKSLLSSQETSSLEAVRLLTTEDKSLPLKTEISDPFRVSILTTLADYLKKEKMKKTSSFLNEISRGYQIFMVSFKRKSRKEAIDALIALKEAEKSLAEKMLERQPR